MTNNINYKSIAYSEVFNILKNVEPEYIYNIPTEIIEYLSKERLEDNENIYSGFDEDGNIKVSQEAEKILIYLFLKYWSTKEEKDELVKLYSKNEELMKEKYNPDNLFKNRKIEKQNTESTISQETAIVEYKEKNFIQKILEKIKHLFNYITLRNDSQRVDNEENVM